MYVTYCILWYANRGKKTVLQYHTFTSIISIICSLVFDKYIHVLYKLHISSKNLANSTTGNLLVNWKQLVFSRTLGKRYSVNSYIWYLYPNVAFLFFFLNLTKLIEHADIARKRGQMWTSPCNCVSKNKEGTFKYKKVDENLLTFFHITY